MILNDKYLILTHSYHYIKNNGDIKYLNNNIYDSNKNIISCISNFPKNEKMYKLIFKTIKPQKKSLKRLTKVILKKKYNNLDISNNLEIQVEIDYKQLYYNFINNIKIPYQDEVFKLLEKNIFLKKPIPLLEYLKFNIIFHEYSIFKNQEEKGNNIQFLNNKIKINNLLFDLENKKIVNNTTNNFYTNINIYGGIIFSDYGCNYNNIIKLIKSEENTLIITNNPNYWKNNINTKIDIYNNIDNIIIINGNDLEEIGKVYKLKFKRFILDDCFELLEPKNKYNLANINTKIKWFLTKNTLIYRTDVLINILSNLFKTDIKYIDDNIFNKLKLFCFRFCYKKKVNIKKIPIKLNNFEKNIYKNYNNKIDKDLFLSLPLNITNFRYIKKNKVKKLNNYDNERCCICLNKLKISDLGVTKCNHFFCYNCIYKNQQYNKECPICRHKNEYIYKIVDNNFDNNSNTLLPNKINFILKNISNNNILIVSKNNCTITNLKNVFTDLSINKNNIFFHTYDELKNIDNIKTNNMIICMEPLYNSRQDKFYKNILFSHTQGDYYFLVTSNSIEEFTL